MNSTRRETFKLAMTSAAMAALPTSATASAAPCPEPGHIVRAVWPKGVEGRRLADLGDGRYLNPVISGDHPDPAVLKDGKDYYATFSSFIYYPGVPIWHSVDLVNWTPLTTALSTNIGSVWGMDVAKHDGRYFIYIPTFDPTDEKRVFKIWVIHAASMAGPWSEPIDLQLDGVIDPAHAVGEDGKRYLFVNSGRRIRLADDGLSTTGALEHVYDGWPIPEDWITEGFALEGPKVVARNGWFYYFSGEGGTAGPPTSHMVIVARSRSINGPWENCPHNPIVRTASRDEPWWSRGHAAAVEGPDGRWWLVYHGYENGFRTLGRQTLLEPMIWTDDGWPKAVGGDLSRPLQKPSSAPASRILPRLSGLDKAMFETRFSFYSPGPDYRRRVIFADGSLSLLGQGDGPANSSPLLLTPGDRRYEVTVQLEVEDGTEGGILLFYNDKLFCGLGLRDGHLPSYRLGKEQRWPPSPTVKIKRLYLRVVNDENVATFYYSQDGTTWTKDRSLEVSGYNHNVGDGFLSLRAGIYAAGKGKVHFLSVTYRAMTAATVTQGSSA